MKTCHFKLINRFDIDANGCWNWIGTKNKAGYGHIVHNKKLSLAHRVSYALNVGGIPDDLCVLHRCDNPACINPDHLFLGTHKDNVIDKVNKGRQEKGECHSRTRLTDKDVVDIRNTPDSNNIIHDLSKKYGVTIGTIYKIRKGEYRTHVKDGVITTGKNKNTKLSDEQVREIRNEPNYKYVNQVLASKYNVSEGHICSIRGRLDRNTP